MCLQLRLQRLGVSGLRAEGRAAGAAVEVEKGRHRQREEQLLIGEKSIHFRQQLKA